jgi:hypothetical protein
VIWGAAQIDEELDEIIEDFACRFSRNCPDADPKDQFSVPVRGEN